MSSGPQQKKNENVPAEDAAMRRAYRWLLVSFICIISAAGVALLVADRGGKSGSSDRNRSVTPVRQVNVAEVPDAPFRDITREAGINFVHINGAAGDKLLPETMGSGCAFFDFDNDGHQDLLLINSTYWPGKAPAGALNPTMTLYRNDGKGHFTNVTANSGLNVSFYGMGVAVGDYDNDGLVDVFVSGVGGNHLFKNLGNGKFKEVTQAAGVSGGTNDWGTSCAWFDFNNDGKLDLFVCNYVQWSRETDIKVDYQLSGIGRAYGPPMNYQGTFPRLYRNDGNGRFTDISSTAGIQITNRATGLPMAKSLGVVPVDLDGDGWMDLIVANDTVQNFVFHNERNGTFKEIGATSGLAFDSYGHARGAMGIDAGRFQNDDSLGISIGNFANEMTGLYLSQNHPLLFTDEAIAQGVGSESRQMLTFGVFFFDYDLDGWLDLLTVNGHIEPEINKVQKNQNYRQPCQLFWNSRAKEPRGGFVIVPTEKCGEDLVRPLAGRASAFADIDGDGDLDVVITQVNGPPVLLRNDQNLKHHWIRLKLVGTQANRDAIGAMVKVRVGNRVLARQVMPTRGYLSQSELPITFGLGSAAKVDEVRVTWPGGGTENITGVKIDALTTIHQSSK